MEFVYTHLRKKECMMECILIIESDSSRLRTCLEEKVCKHIVHHFVNKKMKCKQTYVTCLEDSINIPRFTSLTNAFLFVTFTNDNFACFVFFFFSFPTQEKKNL